MNTTLEAPTEVLVAKKAVVATDKPNWLRHARNACLRVPPLWPLHSFVAVNPFVGLTGKPFTEVCGLMRRVTHESMLMGVDYFQQQFASGRITTADLARAIQQSGSSVSTGDLLAWLRNPQPEPFTGLQSLADIAATRRRAPASSTACAKRIDLRQSKPRTISRSPP
jgi:hypothetical protein